MSALDYIGPVRTNVRSTAQELAKKFTKLRVIWGYNAASKPEHSAGTALDFMVYSDRALGDAIAAYLWANRKRLGVRWIIWRQRIRSTSPGHDGQWHGMADRGGVTANHFDHVHVNFAVKTYVGPAGTGGGGAGGGLPSKPVKKPKTTPYVVTAKGGLMALTSTGRKRINPKSGPSGRKGAPTVRPRGFQIDVVRTERKSLNGGPVRTWAITQWGTYYAMEYLKRK